MARMFLRFCVIASTTGLMLAGSSWGATVLPTTNLVGRYQASSYAGTHVNGQPIVTAWDDSSVNSNNATPFNSPTFNTTLGFPTVSFTAASNQRFVASGAPGVGPGGGFAYFGVLKVSSSVGDPALPNASGAGTYFWDRNPGGNPLASLKSTITGGPATQKYTFQHRENGGGNLNGPLSTTVVQNAFKIVTLRRNDPANLFEIWIDGVLEGTTADAGGALTPDAIVIGNHSSGTQGFTGDFAEILIYNNELSALDFNAVGAFLEERYNLNTAFFAIPEPSTMAIWSLVGLVMMGAGYVRNRRRAKR